MGHRRPQRRQLGQCTVDKPDRFFKCHRTNLIP
jgi:hypothetical protein